MRGETEGAEPEAQADPDPPGPPPRRIGCLQVASLGLLLVLASCVGAAGATWYFTPEEPEPEPEEVVEVRPTPSVVVAVRDLARLEGASMRVERVVEITSRQRRLFGLVEAEDAILLVAAGDIVAGVDLSRLEDGDVVIEPEAGRATIYLPEAEIFSARLDNDSTYVYRRDTDYLARRRETLETEARREAEATLRQAAAQGDLEERAGRSAQRTVEALVRSLGFDDVRVIVAGSREDSRNLLDGAPGLGDFPLPEPRETDSTDSR